MENTKNIVINENKNGKIEDGVNYFSCIQDDYYLIFRGKNPLDDKDKANEEAYNSYFKNEKEKGGGIKNFINDRCILSCKIIDNDITEINYNFDKSNQNNIDKLNKIINDQDSTIGRNRVEITLSKVLNLQNEKNIDILNKKSVCIFYRFNGDPALKKLREISLKTNTKDEFAKKIEKEITSEDVENFGEILEGNFYGEEIKKMEEEKTKKINALTMIENCIKKLNKYGNIEYKDISNEYIRIINENLKMLNNSIKIPAHIDKLKILENNINNKEFTKSLEILNSLKKETKENTRKNKLSKLDMIQFELDTGYDIFFRKLNDKVSNETQYSYIEYLLRGHAILLKVERTNGDKIKIIPYDPSGSFSEDLCINISNIPPNSGKTNYEIFFEYFKDWKINNPKANIEFASPEEVLNIKTPQGNQGFCSYHTLAMAKTFADRDKYNREKLDSLQNNKQIAVLKNDLLRKAQEIMEQEEDEKLKDCYLKQINVLEKLNDTDKIKDFIIEHANQAPFYIKDNNILMTDTQFECNRVVNTFLHSMSLSMIDYYSSNNQTREDIKIPYNKLGETVFKASMGDQEAIKKLENNISNDYIKTNLKNIAGYLKKYREFEKEKKLRNSLILKSNKYCKKAEEKFAECLLNNNNKLKRFLNFNYNIFDKETKKFSEILKNKPDKKSEEKYKNKYDFSIKRKNNIEFLKIDSSITTKDEAEQKLIKDEISEIINKLSSSQIFNIMAIKLESSNIPMIDFDNYNMADYNNILPISIPEVIIQASIGDKNAIDRINKIENKQNRENLQKICEEFKKDKIIKDNKNTDYYEIVNLLTNEYINKYKKELYLDNTNQVSGEIRRINGVLSENYFCQLFSEVSKDNSLLKISNLENSNFCKEIYANSNFNYNVNDINNSIIDFAKEITNNKKDFSDLLKSEDYKKIHFEKIRAYLNFLERPENKRTDFYKNNLQGKLNLLKNYVECFEILESSSNLFKEIKKVSNSFPEFIFTELKNTIATFDKIMQAKNELFENISKIQNNSNMYENLNDCFEEFKEKTEIIYTRKFQHEVNNTLESNNTNRKKLLEINDNLNNVGTTLIDFAKEITNNKKSFDSLLESEEYENIHFKKIEYDLNFLKYQKLNECDFYKNNLQDKMDLFENYVECFEILKLSDELIKKTGDAFKEISQLKISKLNIIQKKKREKFIKESEKIEAIFKKITNAKNELFENISKIKDKDNIRNYLSGYFKKFIEETKKYNENLETNVEKLKVDILAFKEKNKLVSWNDIYRS